MPTKTETRLFTGGLDANSAPFAIEQGAYLNAVNIRALLSNGQNTGLLEQIPGNIEISLSLPSGTNKKLKHWVDDKTKCIYLFYYNVSGCHIVEYNTGTTVARTVINDTKVTGGLGFTANTVLSITIISGLLVWTDNNKDICYLNLSVDYMAGSAISQGEISLITEPPVIPLVASRIPTGGVKSTIQTTSLQFSWRFVLREGFTSVLAPYSLTSFATRQSDILIAANAGNTITLTANVLQKIPSNWKYVEFIVRYPDTNVHNVIKRWDATVSADVTAINNHNSLSSALSFTPWAGVVMEALNEAEVAKESDAVPNKAAALASSANRLDLGYITEGQDTPSIIPTITRTPTTYNANTPTNTAYATYIIAVNERTSPNWYFAIIVRIASVNYIMPRDVGAGKFILDAGLITGPVTVEIVNGVFVVPQFTSLESLILCKEQGDPAVATVGAATTVGMKGIRERIVVEANQLTGFISEPSNNHWYLFPLKVTGGGTPASATIEQSLNSATFEYGVGAKSRAFLPVPYYKGARYYDGAMRPCGLQPLGTFTPATYDLSTPGFTESEAFAMPAGVQAGIPDFAAYYALTLSRATRALRFDMMFGGIVKALFKDGAGEIKYRDINDLLSPPPGLTIYGVGVPIPQTLGYAYAAGDFMLWHLPSNISGSAKVIGTHNGHFVLQYTGGINMELLCSGMEHTFNFPAAGITCEYYSAVQSQYKCAFILMSGIQNSTEQYEVGSAFGIINGTAGAKTFGNFFSTGTTTVTIMGDAHTAIRPSACGGGTGLSMVPNDIASSLVWITDLGRIAPIDRIGKKVLTNGIRWSNVHIPGASINGIASFDPLDLKFVNETAGPITAMVLTTMGEQDGGQMLVICQRGTFTAMVGQQRLVDAKGQTGISIATDVFGDFNPIMHGYGCTSPNSINRYQHHVWWTDVYNRCQVEFGNDGAHNVSDFKASRLFKQLLDRVAGTSDETAISACVNPITRELLVSIPATGGYDAADLNTVTGLPNPFDSYVNQPATFAYNWENNKWQHRYDSRADFIQVGSKVYSWNPINSKFYQEFVGSPGSYYGGTKSAYIAVAFNEGYPIVKSPLALLLVADRKPDQTWLMCDDNGTQRVAGVTTWEHREGTWMAAVRRDRTTANAASPTDWSMSGITGRRLKGRVIYVVMLWNAGGDSINASSVSLNWEESIGHAR